jgi:uncharacterized membrane protein required for colicin V production
MNILLLIALLVIWCSAIYGFIVDDIGLGFFGRIWGALAHAAIAALALGGTGGLIFLSVMTIKEML